LDIILAAILGADGFDFGKLLLIAEGCIMARVCEKNTCPTGIATHAERFKKKYKGMADHIVDLLTWIARDVQQWLGSMHIHALEDLFGRVDLLEYHPDLEAVRTRRGISCDVLLQPATRNGPLQRSAYSSGVSDLNALLVDAVESALYSQEPVSYTFPISVTDRAIPVTLAGVMSKMLHQAHIAKLKGNTENALFGSITLSCKGSAGQGFGVLLPDGITLQLEGEANDSVGKTMSGGTIIITPPRESGFKSEDAMILGNCALYGATGGRLYACGRAGDRFAVRNSGAVAVVEGVGLHACEYMTSGCVLILGKTGYNIGAGMTGGELYLVDADEMNVNVGYLKKSILTPESLESFLTIVRDYQVYTGSQRALALLEACTDINSAPISKWVPCK
jgi:glutamate synthase domain-containing protein 3